MYKFHNSKKIITMCIACILLLLYANNTTLGQNKKQNDLTHKNRESKLVDSLFDDFKGKENPGVSVLVMKNDSIVLLSNYGLANLEYGIPITEYSTFHIASVSKQFTAFAIAMLLDQGKLSLDDDITTYLNNFPKYEKPITIQNLISHTSGIREQLDLMVLAGYRPEDVISTERVMRLLNNQKNLNFEPGTEFQYSNSNYTLLAKIVERITGESFGSWTKKNIFDPLQMTNTFFHDDFEKIIQNRTYSYEKSGAAFRKSSLNYETVGSTGLFTCTSDLIKWIQNFDRATIGNRRILGMMNKTGILEDKTKISYAFGQDVTEYKGLPLIYHPGADAGFRAYLGRFPSENFAVAILSNLASADVEELSLSIADIYLRKNLSYEKLGPKVEKVKEVMGISIADSTLKKYVGNYQIYPNIALNISIDANQLKGQFTGKKTIHTLRPTSSQEFYMDALKAKVRFHSTNNEVSDYIEFTNDGKIITGKRIDSTINSPPNLDGFIGNYFSNEVSVLCSITETKDALLIKQLRSNDIVLQASEPDYFEGNSWAFKDIHFVRNKSKKITGFQVTSNKGRVRNLYFEKIE